MSKYVYPKGDYISGFSEINDMPCDYEIACQTMVIRGCEYVELNPDYKSVIKNCKTYFDKRLEKLINEMGKGIEPSGAMVEATVNHLAYIVSNSWEKYLLEIQKK